jgi:hypothetical protein
LRSTALTHFCHQCQLLLMLAPLLHACMLACAVCTCVLLLLVLQAAAAAAFAFQQANAVCDLVLQRFSSAISALPTISLMTLFMFFQSARLRGRDRRNHCTEQRRKAFRILSQCASSATFLQCTHHIPGSCTCSRSTNGCAPDLKKGCFSLIVVCLQFVSQ